MIKVFCKNLNKYVEVEDYTSALDLAQQLGIKPNNNLPIGAVVDNKSKDLFYKIHRKCSIEFIDENHAEGYRIYINSLSFILYKAIHDLYPAAHLRIEHSAANGYFCQVKGLGKHNKDLPDLVNNIKKRMLEIVEVGFDFEYDLFETEKLIDIYTKQGLEDKAKLLKKKNSIYTKTYKLDNVYNNFYGALAANSSQIQVFDLQPYYKGMLLIPPNSRQPHQVNIPITQRKIFNVLSEFREWSEIIGISDIDDINQKVYEDQGSDIIKISEALHEKKISELASNISSKKEVKVVLISGPSSSGKTSFSKRLGIHLRVDKKRAVSVSMDDYFVDREHTPRDENGDFDFESIEAVDTKQFNNDINNLISGKQVEIPKFNFAEGSREYNGNFLKLESNNILIIEGIHALNPVLLKEIHPDKIVKIYVSALITTSFDAHNRIPTSDLRLVRRLVRDNKYRGMSPERVFELWSNVRKGEEKNIFPYQENADYMFNSALPYELSVMKAFAAPLLKQLNLKSEFYLEAHRLLKLFTYIETIPEKEIPPTSLVREFIGGSSLKY
jgi:uridine kinase